MEPKSAAADIRSEEHETAPLRDARPKTAAGLRHEEIQRRAYEIHIERGGPHLQAERELKEKHQTPSQPGVSQN